MVRMISAKPKRNQEEYQEQVKFVVWLTKMGYRPSGSANGGKRSLGEAIKLKRMGVSAGYPDVFVPLPTSRYHGFFVEMKKAKGGVVSPAQWDWISYLREKGYYAEVAKGFEEAREMFEYYLSTTPKAA